MLNLANKITVLRILIAPIIVLALYFEGPVVCCLATVLFAAAMLTDCVDGYIARRANMVTSFGKFLDPLADKVLICSVLVMFAYLHWIPAWIAIVIICRELVVTGLRAMASEEGLVLAADTFGKIKTILQGLALGPLLFHYPLWGWDPRPLGMILLYAALALTVFSGVNYVYGFFKKQTVASPVVE